ncbi:hypothetical protein B0H17DRAFT_1201271 [Mycena rosella]|uniref:Uncharacterized protein n=1 Tax=Mycena rosella TaxID=1033263 RepID=A0AAD7GHI1_MYCRO|nr:hypothetical protein B0H17DRAFT_1201271 [Mycena rosella]
MSLFTLFLRDNILDFYGIAGLLVVNNLMVVVRTVHPLSSQIAAVGTMMCRMLINLRKA